MKLGRTWVITGQTAPRAPVTLAERQETPPDLFRVPLSDDRLRGRGARQRPVDCESTPVDRRKEGSQMPRLVTGLFYNRSEAERAVDALKAQGIPAESIYLETEVMPDTAMGRKGGEVSRAETERRFAGMETGLIIGLIVGALAGIGTGIL